MRRFRLLSVLAAVLIATPLTSCSEQAPVSPSVPTLPDSASALLGDLSDGLQGTIETTSGVVTGVLACPTAETYSASKTIGPAGGYLDVGPHRLTIPPYALSQEVRISATAPAGAVTTIKFEPHGLRFSRPTALTMSYAHCGLVSLLPKRIVYVDGQLSILEILPSADDWWRKRVTGKLEHFSSYAVAE